MDEDEMDDKDLEAAKEMDKDHQASDEAEIQDLAQEVDKDMQFFCCNRRVQTWRSSTAEGMINMSFETLY